MRAQKERHMNVEEIVTTSAEKKSQFVFLLCSSYKVEKWGVHWGVVRCSSVVLICDFPALPEALQNQEEEETVGIHLIGAGCTP